MHPIEVVGVSEQHRTLTLLCSDFDEFTVPAALYHGSVDELVEKLPTNLEIKHIHKRVLDISFVN